MFPIASSDMLPNMAFLSCTSLEIFYKYLPINIVIPMQGMIPPSVTAVNYHDMNTMIVKLDIMPTKDLTNMDTLVLSPFYMTDVSLTILLSISPVFSVSKNPTSLLMTAKNRSYRNITAILSLMTLNE